MRSPLVRKTQITKRSVKRGRASERSSVTSVRNAEHKENKRSKEPETWRKGRKENVKGVDKKTGNSKSKIRKKKSAPHKKKEMSDESRRIRTDELSGHKERKLRKKR